jgi:hypothetical protein
MNLDDYLRAGRRRVLGLEPEKAPKPKRKSKPPKPDAEVADDQAEEDA